MAEVLKQIHKDINLSKEEGEITDDDEIDELSEKEELRQRDRERSHRYDDRGPRNSTSSSTRQRNDLHADRYHGRDAPLSRYRHPYVDSARSESSTNRQGSPYRRDSSRDRDRYGSSPSPRGYQSRASPHHTPGSASSWRLRKFCPSSSDHNTARESERPSHKLTDSTTAGSESSLQADYEKLQAEFTQIKQLLDIMKAQEEVERSFQVRALHSKPSSTSSATAELTSSQGPSVTDSSSCVMAASVASSELLSASVFKKQETTGEIDGLSDISSQETTSSSSTESPRVRLLSVQNEDVISGGLSDVSSQESDSFVDGSSDQAELRKGNSLPSPDLGAGSPFAGVAGADAIVAADKNDACSSVNKPGDVASPIEVFDEEDLDELELRRIALESAAARFKIATEDDADIESNESPTPVKPQTVAKAPLADGHASSNTLEPPTAVPSEKPDLIPASKSELTAHCDTTPPRAKVSKHVTTAKRQPRKSSSSASNHSRKSSVCRLSSLVCRVRGGILGSKRGSVRDSHRSSADHKESARDRDSRRSRSRTCEEKSAPPKRPLPFAPVRIERIRLTSLSPRVGGARDAARRAQVRARQPVARQLPVKPDSASSTSASSPGSGTDRLRLRGSSRAPRVIEEKEEEERKQEIEKILSLSDPKEQAERFLRLLSGSLTLVTTPTKTQQLKDNYEEVEMDIDSNDDDADDLHIGEFQTAMQPMQFLSETAYGSTDMYGLTGHWLAPSYITTHADCYSSFLHFPLPTSVQPPPLPSQPPPLPPLPVDDVPKPPLPPSPPSESGRGQPGASVTDRNSHAGYARTSSPTNAFDVSSSSLQYIYFGRRGNDEHIPFISDAEPPTKTGVDVGVRHAVGASHCHLSSNEKAPRDILAPCDPLDQVPTRHSTGGASVLTNGEVASPFLPIEESVMVLDASVGKDSPASVGTMGQSAVDTSSSPADDDDEEENEEELRAQLLRSLLSKRKDAESKQPSGSLDSSPTTSVTASPQRLVVKKTEGVSRMVSIQKTPSAPVLPVVPGPYSVLHFPIHKPVVVPLGDSSSEDEEARSAEQSVSFTLGATGPGSFLGGFDIDGFLKAQRKSVAEQTTVSANLAASSPIPTVELVRGQKVDPEKQLHHHEMELGRQRQDIVRGQNTLQQLLSQASKFLADMKKAEDRAIHLREQLHTTEKLIMRYRHLVQSSKTQAKEVRDSLLKKKELYRVAELSSVSLGRRLHGSDYKPHTVGADGGVKRKVELVVRGTELTRQGQLMAIKRQKLSQALVDQSSKENIPAVSFAQQAAEARKKEKERLQKLAEEYEEKIRILRAQQGHRNSPSLPAGLTPQPGNAKPVAKPPVKKEKERLPSLESIKLDPLDFVLDFAGKSRRRSLLDITQSPKPNLLLKKKENSQGTGQVSMNKTKGGADKSKTSKINFKMPSGVQLSNLCKIQREKMEKVMSQHTTACSDDFPHLGLACEPMAELKLNLPGNRSACNDEDTDPQHKLAYTSPLLHFRAYRLSPYYRTKESMRISSASYSHKLNPNRILCRYDLSGTCNDQHCIWQHVRDYSLSDQEVLMDLVAYSPQLAGVTADDPPAAQAKKIESYVDSLLTQHNGKISADHLCLLLTSRVNESANHVRPHTMFLESRPWRPSAAEPESLSLSLTSQFQTPADTIDGVKRNPREIDAVLDAEDVRYFVADADTSGTAESADMEGAVLATPSDTDLWLRLAYSKLSNPARSSEECLSHALNVLSHGLENNKNSQDLWVHYLTLYQRHPDSSSDLEDLCQTAVHCAPCYDIWWQLLEASSSYQAKDAVCSRALDFLCADSGDAKDGVAPDVHSHQVLEMLLYKVTLNSQSGHFKTALTFVQSVLGLREGRDSDRRYLRLLTHADTCVLWISLVHLMEFQTLPAALYNPSNQNPGQIVSKDKLAIPWHSKRDLATPLDKLAEHLGHAVTLDLSQPLDLCTSPQYVQAVHNLAELLRSRKKYREACKILQEVLKWAPHLDDVWLMVADIYAGCGDLDNAKQVLMDALSSNAYSAKLHYHYVMLEISQGCSDEGLEHMEQFVINHFDISTEDMAKVDPNFLFCKLLGLEVPVRKWLPSVKDDVKDQLQPQEVHLRLCYCLLLELQGELGEAVDMYELALSSTTHAACLATLWKSYVQFLYRRCQSCHPSARPSAHQQLQEAMFRSITTAPTLLPLPFPRQHARQQQKWRDLSHVTALVEFYIRMVPADTRATALQAFYDLMPDNVPLLIRCVETALADGQLRRARSLCAAAIYDKTANLQLWKLALALAQMEGTPKEVERLYVRAVRAMPLSVSLWKDFLLFEVSQENPVAVQTILAQCQVLGMNIQGYVATISAPS